MTQINFGEFESVIALIPKLEKFANTLKTQPDVVLNELIDLGYRVVDKAKDEAIKEASEKFKTYINKKDFKFSENSIQALQSLVDFLKRQNTEK
jgi:predicted negative regulator of RcsB-dependent stress response